MNPILIGTGFYADASSWSERINMLNRWVKLHQREQDGDFIIVDNASRTGVFEGAHLSYILDQCPVERIRVYHNLGHIGSWVGNPAAPQILGWSMSWIIPALIAYSERKDFAYIEQDALCFGDWQASIIGEAETNGWNVAFGKCPPVIAACEQSLFWIRCDTIPLFVSAYMAIPESDAAMLPENKFVKLMMERPDLKIGQFSLPGGRARPLPYDATAFYCQKLSTEELAELKARGLI